MSKLLEASGICNNFHFKDFLQQNLSFSTVSRNNHVIHLMISPLQFFEFVNF